MSLFDQLKSSMTQAVKRLRPRTDPELALLQAVQGAGNWDQLEERLLGARALARRRQQEVFDRLDPLANQVAALAEQAKQERIKAKRQHLLRQAEDYLRDLESEEEPAKIYSANARMLTNLLAQVRRAKAMEERGVEAGTLDAFAERFEEIVVGFEDVMEAAGGIEEAGALRAEKPVSAADIEARLANLYDDGEAEEPAPAGRAAETAQPDIEQRLYEDA